MWNIKYFLSTEYKTLNYFDDEYKLIYILQAIDFIFWNLKMHWRFDETARYDTKWWWTCKF